VTEDQLLKLGEAAYTAFHTIAKEDLRWSELNAAARECWCYAATGVVKALGQAGAVTPSTSVGVLPGLGDTVRLSIRGPRSEDFPGGLVVDLDRSPEDIDTLAQALQDCVRFVRSCRAIGS
jgi:hypothetical protein